MFRLDIRRPIKDQITLEDKKKFKFIKLIKPRPFYEHKPDIKRMNIDKRMNRKFFLEQKLMEADKWFCRRDLKKASAVLKEITKLGKNGAVIKGLTRLVKRDGQPDRLETTREVKEMCKI